MYLMQSVSRPRGVMERNSETQPQHPSQLYNTEHAKPVYVSSPQPANIQSYLDNHEPIYQNDPQRKFYELITPQKFTIKSSESFNGKNVRVKSTDHVPSSPDVVKEEKKKKWSLGGLFRRRKKDSESDSSSQEEDAKMGFLARRRSRREKRKQRAMNKSVAGFDHVVKPREVDVMSTDSLTKSPDTLKVSTQSLSSSHDRLSRHDSSGNSGSMEGLSRRERRVIIKQRAEALRKDKSSSDEDPANGLHRSGSLNRRSRYARTERYIKRLSREDESILHREALEKQEGSRWTVDSSDNDPRYLVTSATPSPGQSPLVRPKNILHYTNSAPLTTISNPASLERHHRNKGYSVQGTDQRPPHFYHQKSLSYDNNINNPPSPEENVMVVQFPVARISQFQNRAKPGPPPPPPRDPRRVTPSIDPRPMSYAFDDNLRKHQTGSFLSLNNQPSTVPITVRSNSENQLRLQRPRPASVNPEEMRPRERAPFQYYADQTPRSRKPIHIQYSAHPEQPYMSDSQVVVIQKPPQPRLHPVSQATEFWRQKEQEARSPSQDKIKAQVNRSTDSISSHSIDLNESYESDSLKKKDQRPLSMVLESQEQMTPKMRYLQDCLPNTTRYTHENIKQINTQGENLTPKYASFKEPPITAKDFDIPKSAPAPPVRRFSRTISETEVPAPRRTSMEDALDELEAIYKSLKLGDEDLLDRAERRDLPTKFQIRDNNSLLAEEDLLDLNHHNKFHLHQCKGSMSDSGYEPVRRRTPAARRSGIPDKVTDDMAYRRLHPPQERPTSQNILSQAGSYLLTSPVLSQASSITHLDLKVNDEPDVTYDDVVYRNIRHANNALKVMEPQPPFGIPLGVISPAANSDYLHSKPSERYRPTFKPRRTPDVVGDDLAFRNLRKDNATKEAVIKDNDNKDNTTMLSGVETALHIARLKDSNFSLRKRRAVRSLSANLPSLLGEDKLSLMHINENNNNITINNNNNNFEKAQSLTHLPDALEIAQKILEGKEVIGGGSTHLWANENAPRNSLLSTSTETLTDSRANLTVCQQDKRSSWQPRNKPLRVNIPKQTWPPLEDKPLPIPDSVPGSPLDEGQLEDMLSALARDARNTSEQLGMQLAGYKTSQSSQRVVLDETKDVRNISDKLMGYKSVQTAPRAQEESSLAASGKPVKKLISFKSVQPGSRVVQDEAREARNPSVQLGLHLAGYKTVQAGPRVQADAKIFSDPLGIKLASHKTVQSAARVPEDAARMTGVHIASYKTIPAGPRVIQDEISDDSLDGLNVSQREIDEAKSVLETLHIYEDNELTLQAIDKDNGSSSNSIPKIKSVDMLEINARESNPLHNISQTKPTDGLSTVVAASPIVTSNSVSKPSDDLAKSLPIAEATQKKSSSCAITLANKSSVSQTRGLDGSVKMEIVPEASPRTFVEANNNNNDDEIISEDDQEVAEILHWENNKHLHREQSGASQDAGSSRQHRESREGEMSKSNNWFNQEPSHLLMACTYCIACTQQMMDHDWLTVFGILLAIVVLLAFLIV